jgi:Zn-dependent protease
MRDPNATSIAGIAALAAKLGLKLGFKMFSLLAKGMKVAKVGKVGLATATFGSYAYLFTWQFAAVILTAIFIHESGHVWAMRRCGIATKGIYFLPFLGAAAIVEGNLKSRSVEVYVAMWGPVVGMLLAAAVGAAYCIWPYPLIAAIASWIAMMNLFNLMPINPLDGGRVLKSLMFSIHQALGLLFMLAGSVACIVLAYRMNLGLFAFLAIIGLLDFFFAGVRQTELYQRWAAGEEAEARAILIGCQAAVGQAQDDWIRGAYHGDCEELLRKEAKAEVKHAECLRRIEACKAAGIVPKLGKAEFALAAASFVGLVAILWAIMNMFSHVPGADAAMKILEG